MSIVSFVVGLASGADGWWGIWLFRGLEKEKASSPCNLLVAGGDAIVLAGHRSTLSSGGMYGEDRR